MHYPLRQAQNAVLSRQNLHQDISGQGARTHRREGRASALCNALPKNELPRCISTRTALTIQIE